MPAPIPEPLTWTRLLELPVTTSTPYPPPWRAKSAFTGTAKTLLAVCVVMLTLTGAWSKVADSGVLSKVMVTGTVGPEVLPLPPDEQVEVLAELLPACAPVPDPVSSPLGQVATLPTV